MDDEIVKIAVVPNLLCNSYGPVAQVKKKLDDIDDDIVILMGNLLTEGTKSCVFALDKVVTDLNEQERYVFLCAGINDKYVHKYIKKRHKDTSYYIRIMSKDVGFFKKEAEQENPGFFKKEAEQENPGFFKEAEQEIPFLLLVFLNMTDKKSIKFLNKTLDKYKNVRTVIFTCGEINQTLIDIYKKNNIWGIFSNKYLFSGTDTEIDHYSKGGKIANVVATQKDISVIIS